MLGEFATGHVVLAQVILPPLLLIWGSNDAYHHCSLVPGTRAGTSAHAISTRPQTFSQGSSWLMWTQYSSKCLTLVLQKWTHAYKHTYIRLSQSTLIEKILAHNLHIKICNGLYYKFHSRSNWFLLSVFTDFCWTHVSTAKMLLMNEKCPL